MVELHIDLIAESLSIYGSKVNIVDTEVTEFTGFKLLSPNIQTLRKDILYVCEPSALYKLKKSQIRGACFVCRAQAHVFENTRRTSMPSLWITIRTPTISQIIWPICFHP